MLDRVLYNGNIITLDDQSPRASALGIKFGRIAIVGSDEEVLALASAQTVKEDLSGHTVIPGMTDAHLHWSWTAIALQEVDVFEIPSKQLALERVSERVALADADEWITGQGWSQEYWQDSRFPSKTDLDSVALHHPVYLRAKSGHAAWVNSVALQIAGIDTSTGDPEGGQIGRDEHGEPNGMLFETAMELVSRHVPEPDASQVADYMKSAQKVALAAGLTGFHDYDGPRCMDALQIMRERDELALRVVKNINDTWIEHAHTLGIRWGFGDDWIRIGGLKIFSDGALGPRTALMVNPYENEPDNYGVRVTDKEEMLDLVRRASLAGLPSTIHAIGDLANREVLDVYDQVRRDEAEHGIPRHMRRHRIEHVQLLHPTDVDRLAELDIIASMQPVHATSDYEMADKYWGTRSQWSYNPRLQLDRGVVVAFGSDSPVDPFDPLRGIYAAVTRRRPDGSPGMDGWYPEASVTIDEALRGFTRGPAYAAGMEDRLGKLSSGYLADLVVLDHDLYAISPDQLLDVEVLATMVGGEWRHGGI